MCLFDQCVLLNLWSQFDRLRPGNLADLFVQWCQFARYYQLDQLLQLGLGIRLRLWCQWYQLFQLYRLCLDYLLRPLRRLRRWCPLCQLSLEDPLRQLTLDYQFVLWCQFGRFGRFGLWCPFDRLSPLSPWGLYCLYYQFLLLCLESQLRRWCQLRLFVR